MALLWLVLVLCLLAPACDGIGTGLGRRDTYCTIDNCDHDRIYLRGALPKRADQPLAYSVESCIDGRCTKAQGECEALNVRCISGNDVLFAGGCEASDAPCTDPDLWHLKRSFTARRPDAGIAASTSLRVVDRDTGEVLVDERFELEYEMSAPANCDENSDHLTCLSFEGTWPVRRPDSG
jgi:hypothetical protein